MNRLIWRYRAIRLWEGLVEWGQEGLEWTRTPQGAWGRFLGLVILVLAAEGILGLWVLNMTGFLCFLHPRGC